ncbi:MAG TPA: SRPBCC family protein [Gemmatimonadales bacterium]|nr:SRPBCC family protein [Gemmatimonadales bacterium]
MRTVDRIAVRAETARVFTLASDVERWPSFLTHYRRVRCLERHAEHAVVEMAAWRPFGPIRYPVWWVSKMWIDPAARSVRYRHIRGVTTGMDVLWTVEGTDGAVDVEILHEWHGPRWPLIGGFAANAVIGPHFVHAIAARTLAGLKRKAETA